MNKLTVESDKLNDFYKKTYEEQFNKWMKIFNTTDNIDAKTDDNPVQTTDISLDKIYTQQDVNTILVNIAEQTSNDFILIDRKKLVDIDYIKKVFYMLVDIMAEVK